MKHLDLFQKRHRIRNVISKIILVSFFIFIIPLLVTNTISFFNTKQLFEREYIQSNASLVEQSMLNINNYFDMIDDKTLEVYKNWDFYSNMKTWSNDYYDVANTDIFVRTMLFSQSEFEHIILYVNATDNFYYYSKGTDSTRVIKNQNDNAKWYVDFDHENMLSFINNHQEPIGYIHSPNYEDYLIFSRTIIDIQDRKEIGSISIFVKNDKIASICDGIQLDNEQVYLVNTDNNQILYSTQAETDGETPSVQYFDRDSITNNKDLVVTTSELNHIELIKTVESKYIQRDILARLQVNIISSFGIFLVSISILVYFSRRASKVFNEIIYNVNEISKGNFDAKINYQYNDNLGDVITKINTMSDKLKAKINSEYKAKIALKNAQILALQTQITPHFIYNTLQAISTMAAESENHEIYQMTNALSNLLEYLLRENDSLVSIQSELEYAKSYLYIMKTRFNNEYTVKYDIDDELMDYKIPKLILQPLIENSIKHAFVGFEAEKEIRIKIQRIGDMLCLQVEDNGSGISEPMQKTIHGWMNQAEFELKFEKNIGLKNIISRIKLIYGDEANIAFTSENGATTFVIYLPFTEITKGN